VPTVPLEGVVPFPEEDAARWRELGYWEDRTLGSVLRERFLANADRVAVVAGDEHITYGELDRRTRRLARNLYDLGLRPLDRIVTQIGNVPEFVELYIALQHIGAIPLMALPPHRHREISHYVSFIEARGYAVPGGGRFDYLELARQIRAEQPDALEFVFVADTDVPEGFLSIRELVDREPTTTEEELDAIAAAIDPDDPCVFQLSGGTTGIPKVISRSHNDYVYNSKAAVAINDIRPDDSLLVVLPVAHNFPLACPGIQGFFLNGARVVLSPTTRPDVVFPLIERERITHIELVPALIIRWLDDALLSEHDVTSVRVINSGGQKFQPEVKRRTEEGFAGCKVQEVFGMAEGLLTYSRLDDSVEIRHETVGRPVSEHDEVKLVDEEGNTVADGEIGELLCRGPYTLHGYFRADEHNARTFTPDGWFRTGDLMRMHPTGNLVVEGRKKDLINRGGEKISAEEIENLILTHPAVREVACVPMPDRVLGERMCAFIVPRAGQTAPNLEELVTFLKAENIAAFKLPERVELLDELPISHFGKVAKNRLTAQIGEQLEREAAGRA
jgi:2,3-dihydroxybenzoate-AMP ligase